MAKNFGDGEQREHDPAAHEQRMDAEKEIKRNPHGDFNKVQASRPEWPTHPEWSFSQTKDPNWRLGQGGNDGGESLKREHVEINPYEEGRPGAFNYKLLISAIVPRPIGFCSTRSKDGTYARYTIDPQIRPAKTPCLKGKAPTSPPSAISK